ncbi:MAG: aminopeptidase P family protein [Candidatus Omnitrophica bacterium]|nr:aminopeptidase P family protein [Candidatus Omnitrophota bacterium]
MSVKRLEKLYVSFEKAGIDALLVSSWPNVTYLSGFRGTESWIFVSPRGRFFITDSRYSEQAKREAKGFKVILRDKKSVVGIVADLAAEINAKAVGFESAIVTHAFYQSLVKALGQDKVKPVYDLVETLREIKDSKEADWIRRSADIAVKGYHHIRKATKPGMSERDVQAELEYFTKKRGSEKPAFELIIAAGARSSMPHCQSDGTLIRKDDMVLVDMGVVYQGYHSDLTRPFFLGKMSALHKKIHGIVWEAQRAGIAKAGPGVPASQVDAACRQVIARTGYADYFGHGTGHGVGLEIHEAPSVSARSQTILKPGMVITVEPGIYLPGKFGVRIEDMVLITPKGHEVLTRDLDKPI